MKTFIKLIFLSAGIASAWFAEYSTPAPAQPASVLSDGYYIIKEGGYAIKDVDQPPVRLSEQLSPALLADLKRRGLSGSATISFVVTADGDVAQAQVVSATQPEIGEVAKAAVEKWLFKPAQKNGAAVACRTQTDWRFYSPAEGVVTSSLLSANAPSAIPEDVPDVVYNFKDVDRRPAPLGVQTQPFYPADLKLQHMEGSATIVFIVNAKGNVVQAQVLSATQPEFGESAKVAVEKWKFKPAMKDGVAVPCRLQVPIEFNLPDQP